MHFILINIQFSGIGVNSWAFAKAYVRWPQSITVLCPVQFFHQYYLLYAYMWGMPLITNQKLSEQQVQQKFISSLVKYLRIYHCLYQATQWSRNISAVTWARFALHCLTEQTGHINELMTKKTSISTVFLKKTNLACVVFWHCSYHSSPLWYWSHSQCSSKSGWAVYSPCTPVCAYVYEHIADSAPACSQSALCSLCCEDEVLPSWRGHIHGFFYFFLDAALGCPPDHRDQQQSQKARLSPALLSRSLQPVRLLYLHTVSQNPVPCNLLI